jgi:predicted anti-sigma-YlaC factor YlaD
MSAHHYDVKCREFVERVTDLLEGGIDDAERVRLEQHVVWCEMCADYAEQMRHATRLLAHVDVADAVLDHDDAAALATDLLRRAAARGGPS